MTAPATTSDPDLDMLLAAYERDQGITVPVGERDSVADAQSERFIAATFSPEQVQSLRGETVTLESRRARAIARLRFARRILGDGFESALHDHFDLN